MTLQSRLGFLGGIVVLLVAPVQGQSPIDQERNVHEVIVGPAPPVATLAELSQALRPHQPLFDETGALHAAALFSADGTLELVREDIGRHNAVDKVIGAALRADFDASSGVLVVSGRASYEVIQKALAARIPCVVAVGGVSSLAAELAERAKMVLVGFARPGTMSIYAGAESVR